MVDGDIPWDCSEGNRIAPGSEDAEKVSGEGRCLGSVGCILLITLKGATICFGSLVSKHF